MYKFIKTIKQLVVSLHFISEDLTWEPIPEDNWEPLPKDNWEPLPKDNWEPLPKENWEPLPKDKSLLGATSQR